MSDTLFDELCQTAQACFDQGVTYRKAFLEIREAHDEASNKEINAALQTAFGSSLLPEALAIELLEQGDSLPEVACALVETFVNPPISATETAEAIFNACEQVSTCTQPTPFEMGVALFDSDECAEEDPYNINDVAIALVAVYPQLIASQLATTLNSSFVAANGVAPTATELATALRGTDTYSVEDVAHGVQSQSVTTADFFATIIAEKELITALKGAGYSDAEISNGTQSALPNGANVFMRDNVQETGCEPSRDKLWASPDIIPRQQVASPEELDRFLKRWNRNFGQQVEDGQDNYIYLRVENKACSTPTVAADSPIAYVFYKSSTTRLNPSQWTLVGIPFGLPVIGSGERQIIGPIVWPKEEIPTVATGEKLHFCFVCFLQSSHKPVNVPLTFADGPDFRTFLASQNSFCQRNFNVVNLSAGNERSMSMMAAPGATPTQPKRRPDYHFLITGMTGKTAVYQIGMSTDLPSGTDVTLRFRRRMRKITLGNGHGANGDEDGLLTIVRRVRLKSDKDVKVKVFIDLPDSVAAGEYKMAFSQLHNDEPVGVVNYLIVVN